MKFTYPIISLILCISFIACEQNIKKPGYQIEVLNDMVKPTPYESYSKNSVLPHGQSLQNPVEGTVSRDELVFEGDNPPVAITKANIARGEFIYQNYCLVCHGKTGEGDGPLIPKFPNPPDLNSKRVKKLTTMQIYNVIVNGKGDMPSHAGQIADYDRWKLVYYIETLQGKVKE